jgi:hypothetical protein
VLRIVSRFSCENIHRAHQCAGLLLHPPRLCCDTALDPAHHALNGLGHRWTSKLMNLGGIPPRMPTEKHEGRTKRAILVFYSASLRTFLLLRGRQSSFHALPLAKFQTPKPVLFWHVIYCKVPCSSQGLCMPVARRTAQACP